MNDAATSTDTTFVASATLDLILKAERTTAFLLLKAQLERFKNLGAMEALEEARQQINGSAA